MRLFFSLLFTAWLCAASAQNENQLVLSGFGNSTLSYPIVGGGYFHSWQMRDSGYMILSLRMYDDDDPNVFYNYLPTLHAINNMYGPVGSNQLRILVDIPSGYYYVDGLNIGWYENWQQLLGNIPMLKQGEPYLGSWGTVYSEPDFNRPEYNLGGFSMPNRKSYFVGGNYPSLSMVQQALALRDTVDGEHNGELLSAHFDKKAHCAGEQRLVRLFLSNNGHAPLTSAKIGVAYNGEEQLVINWSGEPLATYRFAVIDSVPFTTDGTTADVTFYIKEVNGQPDFEKSNDTLRYNLKGSVPVDTKEATLVWKTSNFTHTTYIDIIDDESGDVLLSIGDPIIAQGGFTSLTSDTFSNNDIYSFPVDLSSYSKSCLRLRAFNQYKAYFATWLKLVVEGDTVISLSGWPAPFRGKEATFHTTFLSTKDAKDNFAVLVYPNPYAAGQLSVDLPERPGDYSFELYDVLGRRVYGSQVRAGHNALAPPPLPPGLYHYTVRSAATGAVVASGQLVQE